MNFKKMNLMKKDELPGGVWGKNKNISRESGKRALFSKIFLFSGVSFWILGFISLHLVHLLPGSQKTGSKALKQTLKDEPNEH